MDTSEIRRLVIDRHQKCGMGLCGSYEAIARWLFREYNVVTTDAWVCSVIQKALASEADNE